MVDEKIMKEDLFIDNDFTYKKIIKVQNKKEPNKYTEYEFELREISGMESDRISKNAMKVNAKTGNIEIFQEEANIQYLKSCLVKAPFQINEESIRNLSKKIRDELLEFAKDINTITQDLEKN